MSNEAAERLIDLLEDENGAPYPESVQLAVRAIVAASNSAERKATVERIRAAIDLALLENTLLGIDPGGTQVELIRVPRVLAILDAEAAR